MKFRGRCYLVMLLFLGLASPAWAGMAAPLPENPERTLRLTGSALARLQTISFFVLGLLLCAAAAQWLWNSLQRDFPRLPRLSFGKALAAVVLWGLLFIIVLTMISGARELMTPGAWQKQGPTYKLASDVRQQTEPSPATLRRQGLERLRTALLHFAATHNGRFPSLGEMSIIPSDLWETPESGGMRYLYVAGRSADDSTAPLAYEPELETDARLVLQTNGAIVTLRSVEIQQLLKPRDRP